MDNLLNNEEEKIKEIVDILYSELKLEGWKDVENSQEIKCNFKNEIKPIQGIEIGEKWKLCLYHRWQNTDFMYLNLLNKTRPVLEFPLNIEFNDKNFINWNLSGKKISNELTKDMIFEDLFEKKLEDIVSYLKEKIQERINLQNFVDNLTEDFLPKNYDTGLTVDDWVQILSDKDFRQRKRAGFTILAYFKENNFKASSIKDLSRKYNIPYSGGGVVTQFTTEVGFNHSIYGSKVRLYEQSGKKIYTYLVYQVRKTRKDKGESGSYVLKLRDEIIEALKKVDLSEFLFTDKQSIKKVTDQNIIQKILEEDKKENMDEKDKKILKELKETLSEIKKDLDIGDSENYFSIEDEIVICKDGMKCNGGSNVPFTYVGPYYLYIDCCKDKTYTYDIGFGVDVGKDEKKEDRLFLIQKAVNFFKLEAVEEKEENAPDDYIAYKFLNDVKNLSTLKTEFKKMYRDFCKFVYGFQGLFENNLNVILHGAPGTGKTFSVRNYVAAVLECKERELDEQERFKFVQFHAGYDYTDFVQGYKPVPVQNENGQEKIDIRLQDGIFKQFCDKAKQDLTKPYYFLIDEINRADLSRVFGELFYGLEEGYRGKEFNTQYGKMQVPPNVHVIGTMNDVDRGVESIDFALRRRFVWKELLAEYSEQIIRSKNILDEFWFKVLQKMQQLNKVIDDQKYDLGEIYKLGGAYFINDSIYNSLCDVDVNSYLQNLYENKIEPLLREYMRGRKKEKVDAFLEEVKNIFISNEKNSMKISEDVEEES